ncbi:MAG: orotidine-5'-phosphate decarboxylase [candidate division Zixibacteria bacterium]|nr:orotidine-5'-phosphate decarboxylase [candidate division Zixibacteria bacterium]
MSFESKLKAGVSRYGFLCLGLDTELEKLPAPLAKSPDSILNFNLEMIEAASAHVAAFKPNLAFYEALGSVGWEILKKTCEAIPKEKIIILDGKRGDIGNSARLYAKAMFEELGGDAVTVNPYLGADSLVPFMENPEKGVYLLCLTSNPGASSFQLFPLADPLYLRVARKANEWNQHRNIGLVVGATHPQPLAAARQAAPELPFLIPGVGAQGGSLWDTVHYGTGGGKIPTLVNLSRSVLYASSGNDYKERAEEELVKIKTEIERLLTRKVPQ